MHARGVLHAFVGCNDSSTRMTDASSLAAASAAGVRNLFATHFEREPELVASGRVNLIGEHTEYNGDKVLPIAIVCRTWVAVGFRDGDGALRLRCASSTENSTPHVPLLPALRGGSWADYLLGGETRRVREAVSLLRDGGAMTRELLVSSHESLRDLYECSRPELDWLVARATTLDGVRGARLTGAGWAGCAIVGGDEEACAPRHPSLRATTRPPSASFRACG